MEGEEGDDALSGLAPLLRVRPKLEDFCRFGGDWAAPHEAGKPGWAYFHIVTHGHCLLERVGVGTTRLEAGDILLLPHGDAHVVRAPNATGHAARPVTVDYRNALRIKTSAGVEPDTELICGRFRFEAAPGHPLLVMLPEVILLRAAKEPLVDRFRALMTAIRDELDDGRAGSMAIATDLASALFVMMLRGHLEEEAPVAGLLAVLAQRGTAQAVLAMLHDPAHDWTLDALAARAAASRATLVRAFRRACGVAPLAFLAELRLGLARRRLMTSGDPIGQIAADVGYQSEAALSRAFLRRYGVRPGRLRANHAA
jgi:AraC family transcriptional activator of mtrCDE